MTLIILKMGSPSSWFPEMLNLSFATASGNALVKSFQAVSPLTSICVSAMVSFTIINFHALSFDMILHSH